MILRLMKEKNSNTKTFHEEEHILVEQLNPVLKFQQCSTLLSRFLHMGTISPQVLTHCFSVVKALCVLELPPGLLAAGTLYACVLSVFKQKAVVT